MNITNFVISAYVQKSIDSDFLYLAIEIFCYTRLLIVS